MKYVRAYFALLTSVCVIVGPAGLEGCSSKASAPASAAQQDPNTTPQPAAAPASDAAPDQQQVAQSEQMQLPDVNLTPQGLDELLAPIALYPDPVLAVMLQASVDPQQVMDGGNWRVQDQNQNLKEAALDEASKKAGFTPVMQALLHYPTVVDMMCQQFDWTKQLGAAYEGNPKAVLDSVQRLRATAVDSGALKSSPQMTVDVKQDQGQQVVQLQPTDPKVVYVPQYDPQQVYSSTTTTYANGTTTTTTTSNQPISTNTTVVQQAAPQQQSSGVSTGDAVLIGLLSFGAGIALGAAINNNNYYYPRWGYGGVYYGGRPYYPPPYHPYYGGGWGPSYGYHRPVHYGNTNIYVNNNNYYNRFNGNNNLHPGYKPMPVHYSNKPNGVYHNSMGNRPGSNTGASYNRPNNGSRPSTQPVRPGTPGNNNNGSTRPANSGQQNPGQRPAPGNGSNWKGQSTYQGNKGGNNNAGNTRPGGNNGAIGTRPGGNTNPGAARPGGNTPGATRPGGNTNPDAARPGGNAPGATRPGGNVNPGTARPGTTPTPGTRPAGGNNNYAGNKSGDRGYGGQPSTRPNTGTPSARPAPSQSRPTTQPSTRPSGAFGGNTSGSADRAASDRGRSSMGAQPQKHSGGAQKPAPKKR
jgi:hypothetical protein